MKLKVKDLEGCILTYGVSSIPEHEKVNWKAMVKRVNDWHEQQKLKEPPQIMQNAFGQGSQASSVILSNFRESPTGSLYSGKEETPKFATDKPNELLIKIKKLVSNSQKVTSEMLNFDPT